MSTDKRGTEEDGDSNIEGTASSIEGISEEGEDSHIDGETTINIEGITDWGEDSHIAEGTTSQIERIAEENEDTNINQYLGKQFLHPPLTKRRSSESDLPQRKQEHQEQLKQNFYGRPTRSRAQTMSCGSYFTTDGLNDSYFMNDPRLTENAKDLSEEQMLALQLDIFKPLNFCEIMLNRMKAKDNGEDLEEDEAFNTGITKFPF